MNIKPTRMPKMPNPMKAVKAPKMPTGTICGATGAPVPESCEYCVNHRCDGYKEWEKMSEGVSVGTSGTMQDCSAIKINVGDSATAEPSRIENAFKEEPVRILSEEKTVPVPIEQYANMILAMQKLEDVRSIVRQAGYIGERPNNLIDDDDALLSIAAIFQGGNA